MEEYITDAEFQTLMEEILDKLKNNQITECQNVKPTLLCVMPTAMPARRKLKLNSKNILTTLLCTIKYLFLHKICCYDKRTIPKRSVCIWIYPVAS